MFHIQPGFKSVFDHATVDVQCRYDSICVVHCLWYSSYSFIVWMYIVFLAAVIILGQRKAAPLSANSVRGSITSSITEDRWTAAARRTATDTDKQSFARSKGLTEQLDELHCNVDPVIFLVCKLLLEIWKTCKNDVCFYLSFRNLAYPKPAPNDHVNAPLREVLRGDSPPKRRSKPYVVPKSFDDGRSNTRESGYTTESRNYIQAEGYKIPAVSAGYNVVAKHTDVLGVASSTVGSSGYVTGSRDYSQSSYRSKIVGAGSVTLTKSTHFFGVESEADKKIEGKQQTVEGNSSSIAGMSGYVTGSAGSTQSTRTDTKLLDQIGADKLMYNAAQAHHKELYGLNSYHKIDDWPRKDKMPTNSKDDYVHSVMTPVAKLGYNKPTYAVLVGNSVKVYSTSVFASLPTHSTFMVKERQKDSSGVTRVKLALKSSADQSIEDERDGRVRRNEETEKDEVGERLHFRENSKSTGYIIYTCDKRFQGNVKYPLPTGRATDSKIGKGGNGFVFTIYHERKQYAVKKTVYRSNEVNVHSALNHENILPLLAVLMGERHERHSGRFYCFHFMPKMDYDLRQILSSREVGCLKHFYNHCSKDTEKWQTGFNNIKFILAGTLEALAYLHANGYVHRDVKASNIMIKMQCRCQPLSCRCSSKFQVKLGDFDSAGTVPGLGIKEPTDQMIKFASILPLGTPGYRAPEVSMHITLSGPYETLYTFAVDMWSFGCLCLNICIGKTAALKQREEASLLLSRTHPCGTELWEKTTKIKELENTKPFANEKEFITLVRNCLQVKGEDRPSAASCVEAFKKLLIVGL